MTHAGLKSCKVCKYFHLLCLTDVGLLHDVTESDCWPQNGSIQGHIFVTFKHQSLTKGTTNLSEKLMHSHFSFYSRSITPCAHDTSWVQCPFNEHPLLSSPQHSHTLRSFVDHVTNKDHERVLAFITCHF